MFVVTEAEAAAIRAAFDRGGELSVAVELSRLFPGVTDTAQARDQYWAQVTLADFKVQRGDLPGALTSYRASLAIVERLAKADPGNAEWQRDLSVAYQKVGDVLMSQGDRPGALKSYRDDLAIVERLAKADRSRSIAIFLRCSHQAARNSPAGCVQAQNQRAPRKAGVGLSGTVPVPLIDRAVKPG
jgi:tetratricopeptide (TPR) repeat protein